MSVVSEAERLAFSLTESQRAKLAEKLLVSLRPVLDADDDGIDEAIRRSNEMDENPEMSISPERIDEMIRKRFPECV